MSKHRYRAKRKKTSINPKNIFSSKHNIYTLIVCISLNLLTILASVETQRLTIMIPISVALNIAVTLLFYYGFRFNYIIRTILFYIITIITPAVVMVTQQYYTKNAFGEKGIRVKMFFVNLLLWYGIFLVLSGIFKSLKRGARLTVIFGFFIGVSNYFVVLFRTTPIVPWDIFSIGTAISVANNYEYQISWRCYWCSFVFILLLVLIACLDNKKLKTKPSIIIAISGLVVFLTTSILIQRKDVKDALNMDQTLFTMDVCYRNNGFLATFIGNLHLINIEKPAGYSQSKVEKIKDEYPADKPKSDNEVYPDIVVIMDEAFSDLSVLGDFNTNESYMPFFKSLVKEGGGMLDVSVRGGNTANTEFEFLTGDTMAFMPTGSIPYQQYVKSSVETIASQLKRLGYATTAIHPYRKQGWNRDTVYPLFGFDRFLSMEDFTSPYLIRNYISDKSAFEKIEELLSAESDSPQFIFEVTMQNHGGYSKSTDYEPTIQLTDIPQASKNVQIVSAERYLSLIKESDLALSNFILSMSLRDRPTIVIMFGDHQPGEYITNVIDRIVGNEETDSAELEKLMTYYIVPYAVWNNYSQKFDLPVETCAAFLAANVLKNTNIPLTTYQKVILELQNKYIALTAMGVKRQDGLIQTVEESGKEKDDILTKYRYLLYDNIG